jgi:predicted Holliday junction resolvase-like endonuclease
MSKEEFIAGLKKSSLVAECPRCHEEFKLSQALLFDGLGPYPVEAQQIQERLQVGLDERAVELGKRTVRADVGAERQAIASGLGKILEKVIPAHKDFKVTLSDCRPLFEPIDLIAFNGLSRGVVDSVTFYEIKTGKARLNQHEKMVKEAVEDGRVEYKVMK